MHNNYQCKQCQWLRWACPGWMCVNPKHPEFEQDSDYPLAVSLDDNCAFFSEGVNDYIKFLLETIANKEE